MPKIKTNKVAFKKFRVSKSGHVRRKGAFLSHNTVKKSGKRIRRLSKLVPVSPADMPKVEKMLPGLIK